MKRLAAVLILSTLFWGCLVPSLHPIYTEKDLVFDPKLVGVWGEGDDVWRFSKEGEKAYRLNVTVDGKPGAFKAHLVELEGHRFLDIQPKALDLDEEDAPLHWALCLPTHVFMRINVAGDTLKMASPDADDWTAYLKEHPDALKHEIVDGDVVLTADTSALQKFLVKMLEEKDAWNGLETLTRVE